MKALLCAVALLLGVSVTSWAGPIAIDVIRPAGNGTDELWRDPNWSNGFTSMVVFQHDGDPHLLSYKRESAGMIIDRIEPGGGGLVGVGVAEGDVVGRGWTSVITFDLGGRAHFLFYNAQTGGMRIRRIGINGDALEDLWPGSWDPGWTTFAPFQLGGQPYYAAFKESTRQFAVHRINPDGTPTQVYFNQWATPWSSFISYVHNGQPHLMAYRKETGEVLIGRINPGGQGTTDLRRFPVNTNNSGITSRVPFELNGRPHYLTYNVNDGYASIVRIGLDGVTLEPLWADAWSTGWTSIVSFVLGGRPHLISYKGNL